MRLEFTLDCSDLDKMAEFWQAAAGFVAAGKYRRPVCSHRRAFHDSHSTEGRGYSNSPCKAASTARVVSTVASSAGLVGSGRRG